MICISSANYYCCEDISLIENYEKAVNDQSQKWDCHHRLETDENKSKRQLKAEGLYYHRPACELIFLTQSDHMKLHNTGKRNPNFGKKYNINRKFMTNGIETIFPKEDEFDYFISKGYYFGRNFIPNKKKKAAT